MDKLIKAKIKLMRDKPFFGRLCLMLELQEDINCPTMGTDGEKLYFNSKFVEAVSEAELLGTLVHEVLHAALSHVWRRDKRERHRWNQSCDYAVNLLVRENGFQLPQGVLIDDRYQQMNAETIYLKLPPSTCPFCAQPLTDQQNTSPQKKGKKQPAKKGQKGNQQENSQDGEGQPNHNTCGNHKYWKQAEKNPSKESLQKMWAGAVVEALKSKGSNPAGFESVVESMTPRENWKQILSMYLSTSSSDFDFYRRDRRTLDWPFYIPDLQVEEKLDNVIAVLDTSGSISDRELNQFLAEVKKILATFPQTKGYLMECDCEVGEMVEIEKAKIKTHYTGRGGTSHKPVFAEIKKRQLKPKVVICFTDLYTDYPPSAPDYPVLWLATPDCDHRNPPFGRLIKMRKDDLSV